VADGTLLAYRTCDWIDNAVVLPMGPGEGQIYGAMHLPCRIELNRCLNRSAAAWSSAGPSIA